MDLHHVVLGSNHRYTYENIQNSFSSGPLGLDARNKVCRFAFFLFYLFSFYQFCSNKGPRIPGPRFKP